MFLFSACYNPIVAASYTGTKGGEYVDVIFSFLISVMAGVVANIISKWLDEDFTGNEPGD